MQSKVYQVMSPSAESNSITTLVDESTYLKWSYDLEQVLTQKSLWHTIEFPSVEVAELSLADRIGNLAIDAGAERVNQYIQALREPAFAVTQEQRKAWKKESGKARGQYLASTTMASH